MTTYRVEFDDRAQTYVVRDLRDYVNGRIDTQLWHDRSGVPCAPDQMCEVLNDLIQVQHDVIEGDRFDTPFGPFVCTVEDVVPLTGAARPAPKHKGIVCPHCGFDGKDQAMIRCTTGSAFAYLEDIVCFRHIVGFNDDGRLQIESRSHSGEGFDDGTNPRVICGACLETFRIPTEILSQAEFV
jgi:hypothetical protein